MPPTGELVTELCADLWEVTVIDDNHIFASCFETVEVDFNEVEQFSLMEVSSAEPSALVSHEQPIGLMALDDAHYYIQEFDPLGQSGVARPRDILRLPLGGNELALFSASKPNHGAFIVAQTGTRCVVSKPSQTGLANTTKSFASASVVEKSTGEERVALEEVEGYLQETWIDGQELGFVVTTPAGPSVYLTDLAAGTATQGAALPNRCRDFKRSGDGFLAVCGEDAELVRLDASGAPQKTLTIGASAIGTLHEFDRIYWSELDLDSDTYAIRATDESGATSALKLAAGASVVALTPTFVYFKLPQGESTSLRRIPLSEVR
jgi:hypothetical protein